VVSIQAGHIDARLAVLALVVLSDMSTRASWCWGSWCWGSW
jgi:hypothetical protein